MTTPAAFPAISISEAYARLTGPGSPFEIEQREISGVRLRVWKNAPPTLREAFAAGRAFGGKTFLVHGEDRVSFEGFARAALNVATVLRDLGVGKGDRVAIAMRNLPEWPVAFFGAVLVGAIATPLNAWGTGPELEYGLTNSGAKVAFLDRERLERLFEHLHACPALVRVLVCREGEEVAHPLVGKLEDLIGEPNGWAGLPDRAFPEVDLVPEDDATLFYTSGTTGKPKGALGTHRNSCTTIMARPFAVAFAHLRRGEAPPAPDPDAPQKSVLLSVPFFHTTGCQAVLIPSLVHGAEDRDDAKMGRGTGASPHRAGAHHLRRRRADHRLAVDRASEGRRIRSFLAGGPELRRRAGAGRAGAAHQAEVSEIIVRNRLGHDRNFGHLHPSRRRRL